MLYTCVYIGVLLHIRFLMEPLATEGAGIRPSVRVYQQMGGQSAAALECLATLGTLKT